MPLLLAALILVSTAAPAWSQQGAPRSGTAVASRSDATVWGQVRSENTGAPLRHAVIELVSGTLSHLSVTTDSSGIYVLRDVPAGRRLLRATHFDHASNEVEILIVAGKQHVVDFDLELRPVRLLPVNAEGTRGLPGTVDTMAASESDLAPANVRVLESTPGVAELGLPEAARDVPGHEPVDPADVLYVRGGPGDLKLVLLNGVPVYAPFHIGGLIQALHTDVLRSATLHVGGAPARYDGGLSYVMDLETRSGRSRAPHAELGLDMLSGRVLAEGPIGRHISVLAAGRTVHGEGTGSLLGSAFPYGYGDALARVDVLLPGPHVLTATGFWNNEEVRLDTAGAARQTANWGNRAGSVRYRGTIGGSEVLGTVARGRFRTLLPLGGIRPLVTEGTAERTRVTADVERPLAGGRLRWGGSFERIDFEHRAFPQGESRDSTLVRSNVNGDIMGVYGEAVYDILPRLRLRGGLRADVFSRSPSVRIAPRAAATMLLTDRVSLTLSGGQYRQYVRAPERSLLFLGDVVPDSGAGPALTVAEASHVVLALAQDFGGGIRMGLEGFYKEFEGLHSTRVSSTAASGVDLWVRRGTGSFNGWMSYSLAWIWAIEGDPRPTQSFSGRHLVSVGVFGPLVQRGRFDVRVSYGAGLPYTAIPEPEASSPAFAASVQSGSGSAAPPEMPAVPMEPEAPYIRLDAQISRTFDGAIRGFAFELMPYLKVINALNRRDAIFYHYNRDVGYAEPLADLPVVPIVGFEWRF